MPQGIGHEWINVEQRVCELLHESVQQWDDRGKKVLCTPKTYALFSVEPSQVDSIKDLVSHWTFYNSDNVEVPLEALPPFCALKEHKTCVDTIFKMVGEAQTKWIAFGASPLFDDSGTFEGVVSTALDITDYKIDEQHYKTIANYDPLTRLPNRMLLADRLELAIVHARRNRTGVAVCMIDLDGFKEVNDSYGHNVGDRVLVEVSKRMQQVVRSDDTIARLGGDEFVVILRDLARSEDCAVTLYRLLNAVSAPYRIGAEEIVSISASIGVSLYPDDRVEADTLLRHADEAMYKAKNSGKNKFSFFDVTADQKIKANHRTINKIKSSLAAGDFCLYYQPKVNTLSGSILEVEALSRWNHPLLGLVSPAEFLPLVENDEALCEIFDKWVIQEAISQLHRWQQEGLYVKICLNISPRQFKSKHFLKWLRGVIDESGASMELLSYLEFEILETAAVESLHRSNEIIRQCRALGITFALDDFGTGYSTLMHLKELRIDTIKIDKLFVSGMLDDTANMVIVQAVIALANAFDITVTAEGAETIEHVMSLLEMGCDSIQGYAIARPMPADEIGAFIAHFRPDPRWQIVSFTLPSKTDFELLLATSNHKYWIDMVLEAFSKTEFNEALLVLDATRCRFGKWFEEIKKRSYRQIPRSQELDTLHQRVHRRVAELSELLKREKRPIRQEEREEIAGISRELSEKIEQIRQEVEQIKQKNNLINKILEKRSQYGQRG